MLSDKARTSLMYAYVEEYSLYPDEDRVGAHPRTIRSLVKKGLIEPEDEEDFDCDYTITDAGREALGLTGSLMRPPKRLKTAIHRAIVHFLDDTGDLRKHIYTPDKINAVVWVNDEQQADYSEALMVVDVIDADLRIYEDYEWECVGELVRELGFECYVDVGRQIAAFWPIDY